MIRSSAEYAVLETIFTELKYQETTHNPKKDVEMPFPLEMRRLHLVIFQ